MSYRWDGTPVRVIPDSKDKVIHALVKKLDLAGNLAACVERYSRVVEKEEKESSPELIDAFEEMEEALREYREANKELPR